LEGLLGKAYKIIDRELSDVQYSILSDKNGNPVLDDEGKVQMVQTGGSPAIAKWLIDKTVGTGNGLIMEAIEADISTMEGVMVAAQEAVQMMLDRKMTLSDCHKLTELLLRYASIRAFDGVEELRKAILEMEGRTVNGSAGPAPGTPTWGRLTSSTATANKDPAE
jgi:hypothetical protein